MEELVKNITWNDVKDDKNAIKVLDHGFVVLKETMGSDFTIAESARVSYGAGTKTISDDRNLIRYLMRHKHTSPFEMAEARFLVKVPVFVWRQWIRHRTANVNELSGRYSELPNEFFQPEWREQSVTNKQGGEDNIKYTPIYFDVDCSNYNVNTAEELAFEEYKNRLNNGVSRELARTCLPVSHYTIAYWKCDIHNILHFLKLRMHSHAQKEIRVYADAIYNLLKSKYPLTFEAFDDYVLNSISFSKGELLILKKFLNENLNNIDNTPNLSKREVSELLTKIQTIQGLK